MKKYITSALLISSLWYAYAEIQPITATVQDMPIVDTVDEEIDQMPVCLNLQYNLRLRSKDASTKGEVSMLQEFLQDEGLLDTDPTGYFGASTQRGLKAFQRKSGILASGLAGPFTRKAIKEKSCNKQAKPVNLDRKNSASSISSPSTQNVEQGISTTNASLPSSGTSSLVLPYSDNTNTQNTSVPIDSTNTSRMYWVRPNDAGSVCKYYAHTSVYSVVEKRNASCTGSRCVSPSFVWVAGDTAIDEDRPSYLPADGNLVRIWCATTTQSQSVEKPVVNIAVANQPPELPPTAQTAPTSIFPVSLMPGLIEDPSVMKPYVKLVASAAVIQSGESVTVSWQVENATKCTMKYNGIEESVSITPSLYSNNGLKKYNPKQETYYLLECVNTPKNDGKGAVGTGLVSVKVLSPSTGTQTSDSVAFGVYHGFYPGGVSSSSHGEGTAKITIPPSASGKTLVLTAYEPTNWILNNENNIQVKNIIAVGYYDQRLSGDVPNVPIEYNSLKHNNVAQFAYDIKDASYPRLVLWLRSKGVTLSAQNFTGAYEAVTFLPAIEQAQYSRPENALLEIYLNNVLKEKIGNSSRVDSFSQCRDFIKNNNATVGVRCEWGGTIIISNEQDQAVSLRKLSSEEAVLGVSVMCVNLLNNLHRGNESAAVKQLQVFLQSKGLLAGTPTGFFGDKTVQAVKVYQQSKGLPETGMVYAFTREEIRYDTCGGI